MVVQNKPTVLGVEFGSTRIKAVMLDDEHNIIATSDYSWQAELENGIWTYKLLDVWKGFKAVLESLPQRDRVGSVGVSGMMHGYLAFDKDWNLLVDFRTWQNTITEKASNELSERFGTNIPQRWSIAHFYQAILNGEEHVDEVAHITTLSGYVHFMLTGCNVVGIGEASGMFPVDSESLDYDKKLLSLFDELLHERKIDKDIQSLLPRVLTAGEYAGSLTEQGNARINNLLEVGLRFAPPEGDAGTGMVATNSVAPFTGNVSAGTSIFSMVVLDKALRKNYREIDIVATPTGKPVAMIHCNNCTRDINDWIEVLRQTAVLFGANPDTNELFTKLYMASLEGDADCGGIVAYNYVAGEELTKLNEGRPLVVRRPNSIFTVNNFIKAHLYSAFTTLKIGMEILEHEGVEIKSMVGHGGLFKTPGVAQSYLAAACDTPVTCMSMAGEGGPYGMALLTAFMEWREEKERLEQYLEKRVFSVTEIVVARPKKADVEGFQKYMENFKKCLVLEKTAVSVLPNM